MRRVNRGRDNLQDNGFKHLIMFSGGVLVVSIIAFIIVFVVYNNKVKSQSRVSLLNSGKIAELVPSVNTDETEQASRQIGKTVNEMQNENVNAIDENNVTTNNTTSTSANIVNIVDEKNINPETKPVNAEQEETRIEVTKKELEFSFPVNGEIIKAFAKENLVYSETLKEWITHLGIDIKADKTTIVKSAEEGTVKWIKNDPRYGLTVIIEHADGFKTLYANLLTTEFVSEEEKVSKGQTIGTIGTTAPFEIAEGAHLHFEILKDDVQIDPNIYLK